MPLSGGTDKRWLVHVRGGGYLAIDAAKWRPTQIDFVDCRVYRPAIFCTQWGACIQCVP